MAATYRYVNQNPFPIVVPGKQGIGVTFQTGHFATDAWYSRFCGPRQLTRVLVAEGDSTVPPPARGRAPGAAPEPASVTPRSPALLAELCGVAEEETNNWVKKSGIYNCKHCELFRTGSRLAMVNHVTTYHKLEVEVTITAPKPVPKPAPAPEPVTEPPVAEQPASEEQPSEPAAEPEQVFTCPHCERRYKTDTGLARHVAREHSPE